MRIRVNKNLTEAVYCQLTAQHKWKHRELPYKLSTDLCNSESYSPAIYTPDLKHNQLSACTPSLAAAALTPVSVSLPVCPVSPVLSLPPPSSSRLPGWEVGKE